MLLKYVFMVEFSEATPRILKPTWFYAVASLQFGLYDFHDYKFNSNRNLSGLQYNLSSLPSSQDTLLPKTYYS